MNYFERALKDLEYETIATNGSWRILRIDSLIDLMLLEFHRYLQTNNEELIPMIIKYTLMIRYNLEFGILNVDYYFKTGLSSDEIESICLKSKAICIDIEKAIPLSKSTTLFSEYNYLKQLRNYHYQNVIIDTMHSILKELTQN